MKNLERNLSFLYIKKFLQCELYLGNTKKLLNSNVKPFLKGIRNNYCILDPKKSLFYFRRAVKFLNKVMYSRKKILFIGGPFGMEKEFFKLCSSYKHFYLEQEKEGLFTNFRNFSRLKILDNFKFNTKPSLIFVFSVAKGSTLLNDLRKLNIPLMGFVGSESNISIYDYPVPANIKSLKGSFFIYNFFFHFFKLVK